MDNILGGPANFDALHIDGICALSTSSGPCLPGGSALSTSSGPRLPGGFPGNFDLTSDRDTSVEDSTPRLALARVAIEILLESSQHQWT